MQSLTVVVITYNEERKLRRCLDPVSWADEIIVVDSGSTDGTVEIAESCGGRVFQRPWSGFADQRNFGMEQARGDWILFLDADEYVTEGLEARIRDLLRSGGDFDGYKIHRQEHFLRFPIRHGTLNPSYQPRLLKNGKGYWTGGAHAHIEINGHGEPGLIHEDLYHDSHNTLSDFIARIDQYTSVDAEERIQAGQRVGRLRLVFSPLGMAWKCYIVKRGYRDGFPGLLFSLCMGIYSFLRLVKVWQGENGAEGRAEGPAKPSE
ncbi:MAG: glycosyltransferase family 2 protein [Gemmatimonadetes bacterium]|nr:glycosyltransferase family 2 protein [Gemmatimonadota bacterium]MYG85353.1 glycosyltransferase family 2 protein [Gemmatimonadota bacterium]MYJ89020.1 glycosyltransferase family 2 protein [Gemmatimonadota bacterium]